MVHSECLVLLNQSNTTNASHDYVPRIPSKGHTAFDWLRWLVAASTVNRKIKKSIVERGS